MIRAVDVGFGSIKGVCEVREVEYPSAVGNFRPVRFTTGMDNQVLKEKLCVEYDGKRYFIGDIAYKQSTPRVTMTSERFTSSEGLSLMLSALVLLSNHQLEDIKLITGLPVSEYAGLKDKYINVLTGKHNIKMLEPDGKVKEFYSFNIKEAYVLPQPVGTIFDQVMNHNGEIEEKQLAGGRIAVLDIGKHTVDLALTDALQFVDKSSTSFSDIGIFDVCRDLSLELKQCGIEIPADSLEPFIRNEKQLNGLADIKEKVFAEQSEKILSRVYNAWSDFWSFDRIFITGGGAVLLGDHLLQNLNTDKAIICDNPTFTNTRGFFKMAKRKWDKNG